MNHRHESSQRLHEEAARVFPGGVTSGLRRLSPTLALADSYGATVVDADGNRYCDYLLGFGAYLLGHRHPQVNRCVAAALESAPSAGIGATPLEVRLAQKIHQHVPSAEKVLLCNTGSEATFHAVRVARAFTRRQKILKFQGCYHGFHDYLLRNLTATPPERVGGLDPGSAGMLPEALANTVVAEYNDLDSVERAFGEDLAAVIIEPIAHNMGCVLPRAGFLEGLREMCTRRGAVLIFDEVITGFRHSLGGYQKVAGVTPDLTTLGKAMGNGFPIAAVCGKAEIMDHFATRAGGDTFFGGTFNGNTPGCAAALATIEILEREPVHQHLFRLGQKMCDGLREIHERLGTGATAAGFGSIFLTYFLEGPVETYRDLLRNDGARFLDYRRRLVERGIFKAPINLKRNHLSYAHTDADVDQTLEACEDVLAEMFGRSRRVRQQGLAGRANNSQTRR